MKEFPSSSAVRTQHLLRPAWVQPPVRELRSRKDHKAKKKKNKPKKPATGTSVTQPQEMNSIQPEGAEVHLFLTEPPDEDPAGRLLGFRLVRPR